MRDSINLPNGGQTVGICTTDSKTGGGAGDSNSSRPSLCWRSPPHSDKTACHPLSAARLRHQHIDIKSGHPSHARQHLQEDPAPPGAELPSALSLRTVLHASGFKVSAPIMSGSSLFEIKDMAKKPEEEARENIDASLEMTGCVLQDRWAVNITACHVASGFASIL